nr:ribosome silencing factor [uncultured Blautia sp.]
MSTVNTEKMMAQIACKAIDDKKGQDIKVIDIHSVSVIADYFVIASGTNSNQVQAIVDNVEEQLGRAGFEAKQIEGNRNSSWILMDYGDVIVHVFDEENRLFYDLERIWRDGKVLEIDEFLEK